MKGFCHDPKVMGSNTGWGEQSFCLSQTYTKTSLEWYLWLSGTGLSKRIQIFSSEEVFMLTAQHKENRISDHYTLVPYIHIKYIHIIHLCMRDEQP